MTTDLESPREYREACLLWLGSPNHPRETTVSFDDFSLTSEFEAEVLRCDMPPGSRVLPVYFYQHGSLALDIAPIPNPHYGFDSGRAGVAFVYPDATDEDVRAELKAYCDWVNGEIEEEVL